MEHRFDIRFARSGGFAAFFTAPTNTFGWKSSGFLSVEDAGVRVGVRPGLTNLMVRPRTCQFAAEHLTEVYREGAALRLEFMGPHSTRSVMQIWAADRDTAAQIVKLLPPRHAVEIEEPVQRKSRDNRIDQRVVASLLVVVVALGIGAWWLRQDHTPPRTVTAPPAESSARPSSADSAGPPADSKTSGLQPPIVRSRPAETAPPVPVPIESGNSNAGSAGRIDSPDTQTRTGPEKGDAAASDAVPKTATRVSVVGFEGVYGFTPGSEEHREATRMLAILESESGDLKRSYFALLDRGAVPSIQDLAALEARWWNLSWRTYLDVDHQEPSMQGLSDLILAASRSWRMALSIHAESLRSNDPALLARVQDEIAFADMLVARARLYAR